MTISNGDEILNDVQKANLVRAIDFVKFAETKNAALITLCAAVLVASLNAILNPHFELQGFAEAAFCCGVALVFIAKIMAVLSFSPKLDRSNFFKNSNENDPLNYLYFGEISRGGGPNLTKNIRSLYLDENSKYTDRYWHDIGCQVYINSAIANSKFRRFNRALYIGVFGLICLAVAALSVVFK